MPHIDLLDLPYFSGITEADLLSLVDAMEPCQFSPGMAIYDEGGPPPPLYIATAGTIEILKRGPDGKSRRLAELDSPTLVGEIELFCRIAAVSTARALSRVSAFALTRPAFDSLFAAAHPALTRFTLNVASVSCARLAIADEMLTHMLDSADLAKLRRAVFSRHHQRDGWDNTTGVFTRPKQ
ncbi:MAG: cyclic nucleotide-binding domain-containing protein [Deltaproteobacteria bacterium]|nr:cyclic nucleotide-binding domain-containing protein [Deltaproteobacteria bacterium]